MSPVTIGIQFSAVVMSLAVTVDCHLGAAIDYY